MAGRRSIITIAVRWWREIRAGSIDCVSRRAVVIARVARRTPKATVTTTVFAAHVAAHGIEGAICTTRIGNNVTARIALAAQRVYVALATHAMPYWVWFTKPPWSP